LQVFAAEQAQGDDSPFLSTRVMVIFAITEVISVQGGIEIYRS
jgi:hypothetical protein